MAVAANCLKNVATKIALNRIKHTFGLVESYTEKIILTSSRKRSHSLYPEANDNYPEVN